MRALPSFRLGTNVGLSRPFTSQRLLRPTHKPLTNISSPRVTISSQRPAVFRIPQLTFGTEKPTKLTGKQVEDAAANVEDQEMSDAEEYPLENGVVIHERQSTLCGKISVVEYTLPDKKNSRIREMLFTDKGQGKSDVQTLLRMENMSSPAVPYLGVAMTAVALMHPPTREVKNIAVLGVGGGGAYHYFRHYYPDAVLHFVERDTEVLEVAERYFELPRAGTISVPKPTNAVGGMEWVAHYNDPANGNFDLNLRLYVCDAAAFVQNPPEKFDILFQDAVVAPPSSMLSASGMLDCVNALEHGGVYIQNLYCSPRDQDKIVDIAKTVSSGVGAYVADATPNVVFAIPRPPLPQDTQKEDDGRFTANHPLSTEEFEDRAVELWERGSLDFALLPNVHSFQHKS